MAELPEDDARRRALDVVADTQVDASDGDTTAALLEAPASSEGRTAPRNAVPHARERPTTRPRAREPEDSITATGDREPSPHSTMPPGPLAPPLMGGPVPRPGAVPADGAIRAIRYEEDLLLEETEVKTLIAAIDLDAAASSSFPPPPRPAAGAPPPERVRVFDVAAETLSAADDDDSVTSKAPALSRSDAGFAHGGRPPAIEPDEPPTRPGVGLHEMGEVETRPGLEAPTLEGRVGRLPAPRPAAGSRADAYDDESVTSPGPAVPYDTDSVTTRAPAVSAELIAAATRGAAPARRNPSIPADGEPESVTSKAPKQVTHLLRALASSQPSAIPSLADEADRAPENRTEIMANTPYVLGPDGSVVPALLAQPPRLGAQSSRGAPSPSGFGGAAAVQLSTASESGLRAREERASAGVLGVPPHEAWNAPPPHGYPPPGGPHPSGAISVDLASHPHPGHDARFAPPMHPAQVAQPADGEQGAPRYVLLVVAVAIVSVLVPVALYLLLRAPAAPPPGAQVPGAPPAAVAPAR